MAITSENNKKNVIQFKSSHFRYALTYVVITFSVLLFLNIYSSKTSQDIFLNNKKAILTDRCNVAANAISDLQVINKSTVAQALSGISTLRVSRVIVTDEAARIIYDSAGSNTDNSYVLFPEVLKALSNNDVFNWSCKDGIMVSKAASPIIAYGTLIGSVYMMEHDAQQGTLLQSLYSNTFTVTLVLEILLILFSLIFSNRFTTRLRKIMDSMYIIRGGNYSHKVEMGGNDELTLLGDEFNDLAEKLQKSERKRRQFVSDASHELKTPLASIKLLSDSILQNDVDLETTREFVEDIGNEAERLNRMSQKLLTLTHMEAENDIEYEITYVAPTVEKVVKMLQTNAVQNDITIQTDLIIDSPILILEDDLYQILFNLTENGLKYNKPNGKLQIKLSRQDDMAVLTFADTGVGIPEESLESIFERFYRVDKARSRQSGGSGLGLSIVRGIVERNNGQITVQSKLGEGTTFTVYFPIFETEEDICENT